MMRKHFRISSPPRKMRSTSRAGLFGGFCGTMSTYSRVRWTIHGKETAMAKLVPAFIIGLLLVTQSATAQKTTPLTSAELASRTVYRRAVDAAIWGMPLASEDAMRQAYFRDAKAKYNDIIWWPKGSGWKNQSLTVNTSVRYMYFFCNTREDGPVVVDLPPAVARASFYGTIEDAWFMP